MAETPVLPRRSLYAPTNRTVALTGGHSKSVEVKPAEVKVAQRELVAATAAAKPSLTSYRRGEVETASVTVRLPVPLIGKIDARASQDGVSRSEAMRRMLEE